VAGLSLALNLMGLTWGLPARWHPDEKADVVAAMARSGSLAPDSFINPSLPLYALLPAIGLQQRAETAGLSGVFVDPLLAGRVLSALAGAGAVFLLGLASSRTHPRLGLLPPLLLAVAPGAVNLCHFATPEAWLLLGVTATILGALRHAEGRAPAWALGLAVGLSASVKYTAAALLVPAVAAVWLAPSSTDRTTAAGARDRALLLAAGLMACAIGLALLMEPGAALAAQLHLKDARLLLPESAQRFVRGVGRAALGAGAALLGLAVASQFFRTRPWAARLARSQIVAVGLAAAAGFLIGTPFAVLRPVSFLGDLAFNDQTRFEYKGLVGASTSYLPYLGLLADAFTGPALAAVLVGTVVAGARAWRGDRAAFLVLLAFGAPYLLVASSGHQALRFLAAALPAGAWLAALGLAALPGPSARGFAAVVVARAFVGAILVVRLFFVDSRVLATRWMEAHVPPGAVLDLIANHAGYAPPVPPGRTLRIVPTLSREMAPVERFREAAARYPAEASPWLILTASFYQRFLEHPDQQPERAAFFRDLLEGRSGFAVAARFHQEGWKRPGADEFLDPEIVILRKTSG
jgi:Dolichyl-phosphate-mannose-protein mannosyltransferase